MQQARARPLLPDRPDRARDGRQRDVLSDRNLYPYLARATYPTLQFPQYAGEVGASDADAETKAAAADSPEAALERPLDASHSFFLDGKTFIGGDHLTIADIRFAASLEFLRAIDYELPQWAEDHLAAMESTLGDAYSEPAADVRGYVASVNGAAVA